MYVIIMMIQAIIDTTTFCNTVGANEKELRIAFSSIPKSLDPIEGWHYLHYVIYREIVRTLVTFDPNGRLIGDIAQKWTIDASGKEYLFYLKEQETFYDGSMIKAQDVAYSIARHFWSGSQVAPYIQDLILGANNNIEGELPEGIKVLANNKIKIILKQPYPPLMGLLSVPSFGVLKMDTGKNQFPVTSGNYKVSKFSKEKILLEKVSPAKGGHYSKFTIYTAKDTQKALELADSGQIDIALGYAEPDYLPSKLKEPFQLFRLDTLGYLHVFYNCNNDMLKNTLFRQELSSIMNQELSRQPKPNFNLQYHPFFLPNGVMPHTYYKTKRAVIDKARFKRQWESFLKGKSLKIYLRKEYLSQNNLENFSSILVDLGVQASVKLMYIDDLLPIIINEQYDMVMIGYFGVLPDPDGFLAPLHETQKVRLGVFPFNPFIERINKVKSITPPATRLKQYEKILIDLENKNYFLPLYQLYFPGFASKNIIMPDTNFRFDLRLSLIKQNIAHH